MALLCLDDAGRARVVQGEYVREYAPWALMLTSFASC